MQTVREARETAGLSQVDAARAIGVSEPTYRRYERNPEVMSLEKAAALSRVLGVPFMELELGLADKVAS